MALTLYVLFYIFFFLSCFVNMITSYELSRLNEPLCIVNEAHISKTLMLFEMLKRIIIKKKKISKIKTEIYIKKWN